MDEKSFLAYPCALISLYSWWARDPRGMAELERVAELCANPRSLAIKDVPNPP